MKTIGMIGGLSWKSTSLYCTYMNELTHDALSHCAHLVIQGMDFTQVTEWMDRQEYDLLKNALIETACEVEEMGADCLLLCSNTVHLFADEVQQAISIPLIHICDASAASIHSYSIRKIGVLGTKHALEQDFYINRLQEHNLEVLSPDYRDREWIHDVIINELSKGILSPRSKARFQSIIQNLITEGAEGILLTCTEIPLLIGQNDVSVPLFDTAYLHSLQAVQFSLSRINGQYKIPISKLSVYNEV
ncbi:aspartate/glutamate racemase family protein [Ectobacillus panaciterrae]|uniref:aspartate/glutamate racemase family protein n=1 Tax=Ectobacillus panaciterrae TaxID=363872 RepID=UPI0003FEBA01|nr:amino acid racemase [Ectobacillus panaciterrae]